MRMSLIGVVVGMSAAWGMAAEPSPMTAGTAVPAQWVYSEDGGKTFGPKGPTVSPSGSPDGKSGRFVARTTFTIDDPSKVGALKLIAGETGGAVALTDANSVDRYNVGSRPTLTMARAVVNGKDGAVGSYPEVLYNYLTIDPSLLVKGKNEMTVSGLFWFKSGGAMECTVRLETMPADVAALDRLPVAGIAGADFFTVAARAIIPSTFDVAVQPLDPAGPERTHEAGKGRQMKARLPLPAGTKKFQYKVTVKAGGASKTYGPYEVSVPGARGGLKLLVAGNTGVYLGHCEALKAFLGKVLEARPDLFIHMGKYVDIMPWDSMWTDHFFGVLPEALARVPVVPVCGMNEMMSPSAFASYFYFPPDDQDFARWTAVIGNVRLVAIESWSASVDKKGEAIAWLDKVLGEAKEDYVIVLNPQVSHCSTPNSGRAVRPVCAFTASHIDPLLVKHKVTLTIGGHHTGYERVEPPATEGVPTIMTCKAGGSGKPLHKSYVDQNKDSKAFHPHENYCLLEVKDGKLVLTALDFNGKVLDTREFAPRGK